MSVKPADEDRFYCRASEVDNLNENRGKAFEKGMLTGFHSLNNLISFKKGFTTIIYSPPHVGKSVISLDILVAIAEKDDSKIFIYSPEFRKKEEIFYSLIQTKLSQTMYGEHAQTIDDEDFIEAKKFIDDHFVILTKPKRKKKGAHTKITISKVYNQAAKAQEEYGWKFDFIFVDPFNFLEKDQEEANMQVQDYVLDINDKMAEFSEALDVHTIITAHTRDMDLVTDKDTGISYYPVPHPSQIMSGQSWYRGGYQIVAYWRCPAGVWDKENGDIFPENATDIICQKSKPYGIGKLGRRRLYFDPLTHRMQEEIDGQRYYANEYERGQKSTPLYAGSGIQPNYNFDKPKGSITLKPSKVEEWDEDSPF